MSKYNPQKIEKKWQRYWETKKIFNTKDEVITNGKKRKNIMHLIEFPYPSGDLHIGHWYAFALPDIRARFLRMYETGKEGVRYNVMYPIGFDAFGLPAENAAIQRGINPEKWTKNNIAHMTKQLKSMGTMFDWSRRVSTIDPEYYKWTQWIFLKFYENGLAYRDKTKVNWCPKDKTVLANEQVVDNCCERCGTEVIQKELIQWMFRITKYADQLYDDIDNLDWPDTTKLAQKNWIGRSDGVLLEFGIKDYKSGIKVFTTRPDTLFGATYLVVAPEHEIISKIKNQLSNLNEVEKYIDKAKHKTELQRKEEAREKTGVELKGIKAINPANKEEIPVWVADYVLGSYGTGAIMAVPAHDERDLEFAFKFHLPVKHVIDPGDKYDLHLYHEIFAHDANKSEDENFRYQYSKIRSGEENMVAYTGYGQLINSGKFNGMDSEKAKWGITKFVGGKKKTTYRLHDWILSRQRYWGVPIPMINCSKCGYQPVPEKELPVKLPPLKDFKPTDEGRSPLAKAKDWLRVKCPKCNNEAERETDTMDTFVDSSWYFIRYTDAKNKREFASKEKMKKWLPVHYYLGGAEHNTMHLLYSRFFTKALHKLGFLDFDEPFLNRRNRGIILGSDSQKMSKSRGNVVDPDPEVKKYGADTVRMYLAFMGPYLNGGSWQPNGIVGVHRFLKRFHDFIYKKESQNVNIEVKKNIHRAIKEIGTKIDNLEFNTVVSDLMKLLNALENELLLREEKEILLKLLAPFAPHMAEELWHQVGNKKSIHLEKWPKYDSELIKEETVDLIVQINGKTRDIIKASHNLSESQVRELVLASEKIKKYIAGKEIKRFIYIPNKLANIVI